MARLRILAESNVKSRSHHCVHPYGLQHRCRCTFSSLLWVISSWATTSENNDNDTLVHSYIFFSSSFLRFVSYEITVGLFACILQYIPSRSRLWRTSSWRSRRPDTPVKWEGDKKWAFLSWWNVIKWKMFASICPACNLESWCYDDESSVLIRSLLNQRFADQKWTDVCPSIRILWRSRQFSKYTSSCWICSNSMSRGVRHGPHKTKCFFRCLFCLCHSAHQSRCLVYIQYDISWYDISKWEMGINIKKKHGNVSRLQRRAPLLRRLQ